MLSKKNRGLSLAVELKYFDNFYCDFRQQKKKSDFQLPIQILIIFCAATLHRSLQRKTRVNKSIKMYQVLGTDDTFETQNILSNSEEIHHSLAISVLNSLIKINWTLSESEKWHQDGVLEWSGGRCQRGKSGKAGGSILQAAAQPRPSGTLLMRESSLCRYSNQTGNGTSRISTWTKKKVLEESDAAMPLSFEPWAMSLPSPTHTLKFQRVCLTYRGKFVENTSRGHDISESEIFMMCPNPFRETFWYCLPIE